MKRVDFYSLSFEQEKKIAVQMWKTIKRHIMKNPDEKVVNIKDEYISRRFLNDDAEFQRFVWYNDCILCEHVHACDVCPLSRIGGACIDSDSAYSVACDNEAPVEYRLEMCDLIIRAIKMLKEEDCEE